MIIPKPVIFLINKIHSSRTKLTIDKVNYYRSESL